MRRSMRLALFAVLGTAIVTASPVSAQPNTCVAGKIACTNAFSAAVFKCYAKIFKSGFTGETQDKAEECVRKARRKFGTAVNPKPACWDKVEAKQSNDKPETVCPVTADEYDIDDLVHDFTLDIVANEVAPSGPRSLGSSCGAGKVGCVGTLFKKILGCEVKAHKTGVPADEACVAKAIAKFTGGGNPAASCFAKLEAKQKLGKPKTYCDAEGNTLVAGGKAEQFAAMVVVYLEP